MSEAQKAGPSKIIPNSFQSPNWLVDDVMRYLSGNEVKCLDVICRKTFGWHKRSDRIAKSQLMDLTGMGELAVDESMASLVSFGLVVRLAENDRANRGVEWSIQEDDTLVNVAGLQKRFEERREANRRKTEKASLAKGGGVVGRPQVDERPPGGVVGRPEGGVDERPPQKTLSKATNKNQREGESGVRKFDFSPELVRQLERGGIYGANWTDVALYLRAGNSEADVIAVLDWMREKNKNPTSAAQRFVLRIRERAHAPKSFYPLSGPDPVCEGVCVSAGDDLQADSCVGGGNAGGMASADAPISPTGITAGDAWRLACGQLELEMRRETFVQYMGGTVAYSWDDAAGVLCVQARTEDVCDWLRDRVTRTAERLLAGILNRDVAVRWVTVQAEVPA
jgi:phage replication O-like protein O